MLLVVSHVLSAQGEQNLTWLGLQGAYGQCPLLLLTSAQLCLTVNTPPGHHDQWWGLMILHSLLESGTEPGGWEWGLKGLSTSSSAQFSHSVLSNSL